MQDIVTLAKFGSPYGVHGWIKLHSFTQPAENIMNFSQFYVHQQESWQPIEIIGIKPHGNSHIAKLAGINQPEQAKAFTNNLIGVNRTDLPELEQDEHYWSDLVGLAVRNLQEVDLGTVDYLFATGANDVIVVKDQNNKERLLPYTETVIKKIDFEQQLITVDWDHEF